MPIDDPSRLPGPLDRLHARMRRSRWLLLFTWFNRVALAVGFLPPGAKKLLGHRFTGLPLEDPVGFYFEAFYRTGPYYRWVGAMQILAALLLLVPRTALLGAMIYLPIILNIFLITLSMRFAGTPFVTGAMLLACLYLLAWDYPRWKGILPFGERPPAG